ncbi:MAG: RNA-binding S4 domain-containing protein [Pseudomonadota bacterium]
MDHGVSQRIDQWLWHARIVKSRTLAGTLAAKGHIRVNREKTRKASQTVRRGDVLTLVWGGRVRIIEIVEFADRRGPAAEAQTLYIDKSPPVPPKSKTVLPAPDGERDKGAGRPTKRDRRQIDSWRSSSDEAQ